jgi:hypothetical protein
MDYAELSKKFRYTDMNVYPENSVTDNYMINNDLISDEEDMHEYGRKTLSDYRPDPRTMEYDQKQSKTDSVSVLRLHYAGTRAGDEPSNYNREIFLEDTEKDPRRTFTDPDFRESVKQTWARQKFLVTNLYPEDPGTGSITGGNVSQYTQVNNTLRGREMSKGYYKSMLQDSLDGTEPRREFRFDPYSYIDKALANQSDLPYQNPDRKEYQNVPMNHVSSMPHAVKVSFTDNDIVLQVAKLGRGTTAHRSAEDNKRIFNKQLNNVNDATYQSGRTELMTDETKTFKSSAPTILNEIIRKVVENTVRAESQNGKSANSGMNWGAAKENVRRALNAAIEQQQMVQSADVQNSQGIRGKTDRTQGGGAKEILKNQIAEESRNLLAVFKDIFNKASLPMSSIVGNTVTSAGIQQEVNKVNENWRIELTSGINKARSALTDDIQRAAHNIQEQNPWNETTGRSLEVVNYKAMKATDMHLVDRYTATQPAQIGSSNDKVSIRKDPGRINGDGDTNSLVYAANQGQAFNADLLAAAGSKGGMSAPLGNKQPVRFKVNESDDWVSDTMDVGDVSGRASNSRKAI